MKTDMKFSVPYQLEFTMAMLSSVFGTNKNQAKTLDKHIEDLRKWSEGNTNQKQEIF